MESKEKAQLDAFVESKRESILFCAELH